MTLPITALQEYGDAKYSSPDDVTPTVTLVPGSERVHTLFPVAATNRDIVLPDATKLKNGHIYFMFNVSGSNTMDIRDAGSNLLVGLAPNNRAMVLLLDNSTTNGTWIIQTKS